MRIITKDPRNVVPDLTEQDIVKNIVIIVQNIRPDTYIVIAQKIGNQRCYTTVGNVAGSTIWNSCFEPTLIGLLIKEYVTFRHMNSEIIVLESRQDAISTIKKYNISNNQIISMLLSKRFGDII